MPAWLTLVTDVDTSHDVNPQEAIDRLTQGVHGEEPVFYLLPGEEEVLRRTFRGQTFPRESLDMIVQEFRWLSECVPEDDETWDDDTRFGLWQIEQYRAYVEDARAVVSRPVQVNNALTVLRCHQDDVVRETGRNCRSSLLRAIVVAFHPTAFRLAS